MLPKKVCLNYVFLIIIIVSSLLFSLQHFFQWPLTLKVPEIKGIARCRKVMLFAFFYVTHSNSYLISFRWVIL